MIKKSQIDPTRSHTQLLELVHVWKDRYTVNNEGDTIIQNNRTMTNVRFTDNGFHEIQKHPRGFELIPEAIHNPDEIWSGWGDKKQRIVLRNYILFGDLCYVVQTKDGQITDAFLVTKTQANKFRVGVPLI